MSVNQQAKRVNQWVKYEVSSFFNMSQSAVQTQGNQDLKVEVTSSSNTSQTPVMVPLLFIVDRHCVASTVF